MITVYHGTAAVVQFPLVSYGRINLDFGQGFYVTDIHQQAVRWAERVSSRKFVPPVVNVYEFDKDEAIRVCRYLYFESYNREWLDFVVANRSGKMLWKAYDVIEGDVANDNVIDTVEDYLRGRMSADAALRELSKHQSNNQFCFLNQDILDKYLRFIGTSNI